MPSGLATERGEQPGREQGNRAQAQPRANLVEQMAALERHVTESLHGKVGHDWQDEKIRQDGVGSPQGRLVVGGGVRKTVKYGVEKTVHLQGLRWKVMVCGGGRGVVLQEFAFGEIQDVVPILLVAVMAAGANEIAHAPVADGLSRLWEFGIRRQAFLAPGSRGHLGRQELAVRVGVQVVLGAGHIQDSRSNQGHQLLLVERDLRIVADELREERDKPVFVPVVKPFDVFTEIATGHLGAHGAGTAGDEHGGTRVVGSEPERRLTAARQPVDDETVRIDFRDALQGVETALEPPDPGA